MKKFLSVLIMFTLLEFSVHGEGQKRYATPEYDWTTSGDVIKGGGNVITGGVQEIMWQPFILRTDKDGKLEWAYAYNIQGTDSHFNDIASAKWTNDAFAAIGITSSLYGYFGSFDVYFVIVDKLGMPVASKIFGTSDGDLAKHIEAIDHPAYGGYVFTGRTVRSGSVPDKQDIIVGLLDHHGDLVDSMIYQFPLVEDANWIETTRDGGFIVAGTVEWELCDGGKTNIFVVKLDQQLNVEWNRVIDIYESAGYSNDSAMSIKQDPEDNYHITGTSIHFEENGNFPRPFLLSLDSGGKVLSLNLYDVYFEGTPSPAVTYSLVNVIGSGGIENLLVGTSFGAEAALLINTDEFGNVNWAKGYPAGHSTSFTKSENIELNPDTGGYMMTGAYFDAHPPNTGYDINLIMTDEYGKTGEDGCIMEMKVEKIERKYCTAELDLAGVSKLSQMNVPTVMEPLHLETTECKDDAVSKIKDSGNVLLSSNPVKKRRCSMAHTGK